MKRNNALLKWIGLAVAAIGCLGGLELQAQTRGGFGGFPGFGGGFGGFGGFGGGGRGAGGFGNNSSSRQYPSNGTVGDAVISYDPETKSIVVIADEETGKYISQVIKELDRPLPQVLIKVIFVEVTYNNSLDFGVEGGYVKNIGNNTTSAVANVFGLGALNRAPTNTILNSLGQPISSVGGNGAGLYQILSTDYQVTLRAIAQAGKTEVLSRPSILARNNQPAYINVGNRVPIVTGVTYDTFGNQRSAVNYQDVGIKLQVTPYLSDNGLVEMILAPEISSLTDQTVNVAAGVNLPLIATRNADTVVVTPQGQTVVIGGLMQKSKTQNDSKIPLLGDIPGLGNLFKHRNRNNSRTELLIFLTPHIVNSPGDLAGVAETERAAQELVPKAFPEQELRKFLDDAKKQTPDDPSAAWPAEKPPKRRK